MIQYVPLPADRLDECVGIFVDHFSSLPQLGAINLEKIKQTLRHPRVGTLVAMADGVFAGMLVCAESTAFYSDDIEARELLCCVSPEYRKLGIGRQLYAEFEKWARARGAMRVWIGQSTGHADLAKLCEGYQQIGYEIHGACAVKEI